MLSGGTRYNDPGVSEIESKIEVRHNHDSGLSGANNLSQASRPLFSLMTGSEGAKVASIAICLMKICLSGRSSANERQYGRDEGHSGSHGYERNDKYERSPRIG
jgi:hypothetical protein